MPHSLRALAAALAALSLIFVPACDSDAGDPAAADLYGLWVNVDAGTVRAFRFAASDDEGHADLAGRSDVYTVALYAEGASPAQVQRGTYEILEGHLVTTVTWAEDAAQIGRDFANIILGFGGDRLTLESTSAASGRRVFTKMSDYP